MSRTSKRGSPLFAIVKGRPDGEYWRLFIDNPNANAIVAFKSSGFIPFPSIGLRPVLSLSP